MTILSELKSVDLTEDRVRRFEAIHEAIRDANASLAGALVLLRTRAGKKNHAASGVMWTLVELVAQLESKEYQLWAHAFGAVMAHHTLWSGFTALADPDKVPKAVAANVLKMSGTGGAREPEKPAARPSEASAQDLKRDMLG